MFIRKEEFERVVSGLQEEIDETNNKINLIKEEWNHLDRIVRYMPLDPDGVSHFLTIYRIDDLSRPYMFGGYYPKLKKRLYIYHNREEFAVNLEELDDKCIVGNSESIKWLNKKDSLVEFTAMAYSNHMSHVVYKHTFAIDITTGKYLHKSEMVNVAGVVDDCKKED